MPIDVQERDRGNIYDILRILIVEGKQEVGVLISIIRTRLGIRRDRIFSDYLKPMYQAGLIDAEKQGGDMLMFISDEGRQFLAEYEAKALAYGTKEGEKE